MLLFANIRSSFGIYLIALTSSACGGDEPEDIDSTTGSATSSNHDTNPADGDQSSTDESHGSITTSNPNDSDSDGSGPSESDGSGGGNDSSGGLPPPGVDCTDPFTYQGLDGCVAEVEGIQVKFFPLPPDQPVDNLAIYFHGDTAPGWYENWAFPTIVDWAAPRNILTLGVLSPKIGGSGLPEFGEAQPPDAEAVATAIEAFADAYGAPRDEIFYWSTSGGSWFFTSSFIPVAGGRLPGYFAASCGGSGFSYDFAWDPNDSALRDKVTLFFNYGTEDFLAESSDASFLEYQQMGFSVDRLIHEGATHCAHPIAEPTIDYWTQFLD